MTLEITLDPDIAEGIEEEVRRVGKPAQALINQALRTRFGLVRRASSEKPFRVEAHEFGFALGIHLDRMNRLVDDLECAAIARKIKE